MNVPNILTLCRFVLIPVYIAVFAAEYPYIAFGIVVLAGVTDMLDGYLARRNNQITEVGKMLDPLADKSFMIVVIVTLLWKGMISWQAAVIIFFREIGMIVGSAIFHFSGKKTVQANAMGKLTTVLFYVAIMLIFFDLPFAGTILWIAIGLSFLAAFIYIGEFRLLNQRKTQDL